MKRRRQHLAFRLLALSLDAALAVACLGAAVFVRVHVPLPWTESLLSSLLPLFGLWNVLLVVGLQVTTLWFFGLYNPPDRQRDRPSRVIPPAIFVEFLLLSAAILTTQPQDFPRTVLLLYITLDLPSVLFGRLLLNYMLPQPRRRVAILGVGSDARRLAASVSHHPGEGIVLVGVIGDSPRATCAGVPVLGGRDELTLVVERQRIDELILTPESIGWRDTLAASLRTDVEAEVLVWPSPFETLIGRANFRFLGDIPLLEAYPRTFEGPMAALKRMADLALAALGLAVAAPLLLLAALAIAAGSPGGVVYAQVRVGRDGRLFRLFKLRTMVADAERQTGAVLAAEQDPRVTRIGRWLRQSRLDELPQLWNVLRGDMSLVGPRPERPEFVEELRRKIPGYSLRHIVRPGVTGLAQILGGYATDPEIKLRYDLAYISHWSPTLDVGILLRTIPVALVRRGM